MKPIYTNRIYSSWPEAKKSVRPGDHEPGFFERLEQDEEIIRGHQEAKVRHFLLAEQRQFPVGRPS